MAYAPGAEASHHVCSLVELTILEVINDGGELEGFRALLQAKSQKQNGMLDDVPAVLSLSHLLSRWGSFLWHFSVRLIL